METALTALHKRKAMKVTKSKKNPVKVVYISSPMMIKTSVSKFRALVQELTGQDAGLPDPTTKLIIQDKEDSTGNPTVLDASKIAGDHSLEVPSQEQQQECSDFSFEDDFIPRMVDNFSELLPSSLYCESFQVDALMRSPADAM